MPAPDESAREAARLFESAEWYDRTINWSARFGREMPVLTEVFGSPGAGGLVDAGCGTGRHAAALANSGYRVMGVDVSPSMLRVAREVAAEQGADLKLVCASFATLCDAVGGGFDGVYCLGNSLAAAGGRDEAARAVDQFARCLRPGGRLFLQILNFAPMRSQQPCIRGPRVSIVDGCEYISIRQFHFVGQSVQVTNVTLWHDNGWHQASHSGMIYPISLDEVQSWCAAAGLCIDAVWGGYNREPFDIECSVDLIVTATAPSRAQPMY